MDPKNGRGTPLSLTAIRGEKDAMKVLFVLAYPPVVRSFDLLENCRSMHPSAILSVDEQEHI